MYSKKEEAVLREKFWTSFGLYLAPVLSSSGKKIHWINYKTDVRFIHFKMDVNSDHAYIGMEFSGNNKDMYFKLLRTLKNEFEIAVDEKWIWEQDAVINGKRLNRVYKTIQPVNIYRQSDWPAIIGFLKSQIIALDQFWNMQKDLFEFVA